MSVLNRREGFDPTQPITSEGEAVAFIRTLWVHGLAFHFDDAPDQIIDVGTGERTFSDEECPHLARRVDELWTFLSDPIAVALVEWELVEGQA